MYSSWTSPTTLVGMNLNQSIVHLDLVSGKTLLKTDPWPYKPADFQTRCMKIMFFFLSVFGF